ncbi:OPT/YSL family transporter [Ihubacter sp. mB4P-1]|uniref:OPT/YSL family transporter n=1 Tax=Ihubacter sp. mB4P-1 TaxID=3242370 RepID=UPI003C7A8E9A
MKKDMQTPSFAGSGREFSFRAIFFGILIGLMLMALMMYLDAVLGLDTDVAVVASMIGVILIPLFGGPTNKREVNMMQTCATATTFAAYSLTGNVVPLLMMGEELRILPTFAILLLADVMGICFVSILRDQFVYDENLPFPGAVMCTTAMEQIDTEDKSSTKILAGAVVVGLIVSFLQNMDYIPWMVSFTSWLPVKGMSLEMLIMPMTLGMGYVLGAKIALCMLAANLLVCLVEGPIGTSQGWFANPAEDYFAGIQDFNLPIAVGTALFAALIPICRQWRTFAGAFNFKKGAAQETDRDYSMKSVLLILLAATVALTAFCNLYYGISIIHLLICIVISLLFAMIAVRVYAESGLSAGLALNITMIVIAYLLTKNAVFSMLIAFMNFNMFILAQDTMYDLKIGQMVKASPKKQIRAQLIGVFFGCLAGTFLFAGIIKVFGLDGELFTFPFGNMYYSVISGISEGGATSLFNPMRFVMGAGFGTLLSFAGLPAGGIALALYLAPKTIMGIALGGIIRWIIEKTKGDALAEKMDNAATGLVIGDAVVCVIMVIMSLAA